MADVKKSSGVDVSDRSKSKGDQKAGHVQAPVVGELSNRIEKELRSLGGVGGDMAESIAHNWQYLLVFFVVGLSLIGISHGFLEVRQQNREETAKEFQEAQSSFASLEIVSNKKTESVSGELAEQGKKEENSEKTVDGDEEKTEEHNVRAAEGFREIVDMLTNSLGSSSGYGLLANLYKASGMVAEHKYGDVRGLLDNVFDVRGFIASGDKSKDEMSAKTISFDLALLLYSRSFIAEASLKTENDEKKGGLVAEGIAAAKALAERGFFANVEALILLSRLGDDVFSSEQLQQETKQVLDSHPEMRPQIEKELPQVSL